jgi:signal recognition particle receptor subunit beta
MLEFLVIGAENSGKTLLIKKIKNIYGNDNNNNDDDDMIEEDTMATVGVDITTISLNNNKKVTLREIGGSMVSRWLTFLDEDNCNYLIFVIDISNMSSLSTSLVLLMEMFTIVLKVKKQQRILIIFNKIDLIDVASRQKARNILSINEIIDEGKRNGIIVDTLEGSSIDNTLALNVIRYIKKYLVS